MSAVQEAGYRWLVLPDEQTEPPSRELIGGKAWSLWRMRSLGLRVPPAFVITTEACRAFFDNAQALPAGLVDEMRTGVATLENDLGRKFGGTTRPLLVSVRSGAAISMPGMMDTILNLGMNAEVESALADETGSPDFAAEVHRRFVAFYGQLVLGCVGELDELTSVDAIRTAIREEVGAEVPSDPWMQLEGAVASVFASSQTRRAKAYREHHGIPHDVGTAVTIQAMVFGNLDDASGTGVLFSRNPLSGERTPYGEYLPCGQGEDVVSGKITPQPLEHLAASAPDVHTELLAASGLLDAEGRDAQDIEFTVQQGVLYLLQSRSAKRTARAAVRIAVELHREGVLTPDEALSRVNAAQVRALLRPIVAEGAAERAELLAEGVAASPGVATGLAVATSEEAEKTPGAVLVRKTTSPEDVHGMIAAAAVITENGGSTSHAAVVCRALDTPSVVGCGEETTELLVGRIITVDAINGKVYAGELATIAVDEDNDPDLQQLVDWARERSPITVATTADEAPQPLFDADPVAAELASDEVPPIPDGTASVTGACFGTEVGVEAALDAGVRTIVATRVLPVLLTVITVTERSS